MTIAVYARPSADNHVSYITDLHALLAQEHVELILHETYYIYLKTQHYLSLEIHTFATAAQLISKADYLICFGGDGTMLEALTYVRTSGIPVLGINTGRLGFLSSVHKDDLQRAVKAVIHEQYTLDKRELLQIDGYKSDFDDLNYALNECTIHKHDRSAMIHIDTFVDDVYLNTYFADGIIISTSTGSTAYSLSCGGPIIMPDSDNFIITPVAPHNLAMRPLVISNHHELRFQVEGRTNAYNITLDNRTVKFDIHQTLRIKKADFKLNLINLEGHHFFNTLRNKLMWGADKRF